MRNSRRPTKIPYNICIKHKTEEIKNVQGYSKDFMEPMTGSESKIDLKSH